MVRDAQSLPLNLPTKRSSICLHKCEMQLAKYTYYISWTRILRRGMCRFHLLCLRNVAFSSFVLRNVSLSSVASWDVSVPVHVPHIWSSLRTSMKKTKLCNLAVTLERVHGVLEMFWYIFISVCLSTWLSVCIGTVIRINKLEMSCNNTQIVCSVLR